MNARRHVVGDRSTWPSTACAAAPYAACSERDVPAEAWTVGTECAHPDPDDVAAAPWTQACAYVVRLVLDPLNGVRVTVTDYPDGCELAGLDWVRPEAVAPALRAAMVAEDRAHADCWRPVLGDVLELVADAAGWDDERLLIERVCLALAGGRG